MSTENKFTAAMVQMRTGLLPEPSLEQGTRLIREAAAQGAKYVLTPEVSNMMQLNRAALFEHLASEEDDKSLQAYRALAAELAPHVRQTIVGIAGYLGVNLSPYMIIAVQTGLGADVLTEEKLARIDAALDAARAEAAQGAIGGLDRQAAGRRRGGRHTHRRRPAVGAGRPGRNPAAGVPGRRGCGARDLRSAGSLYARRRSASACGRCRVGSCTCAADGVARLCSSAVAADPVGRGDRGCPARGRVARLVERATHWLHLEEPERVTGELLAHLGEVRA